MKAELKTTVSKDYLTNLEKKVSDLQTLIEVSAIISSTLEFNDLITLIMEKAKNVMDAEACSILLYNSKTNKLEFEVAINKEEATSDILKKRVSLDMGEGVAGWVAEEREPQIVENAKTDKRFFAVADKLTGFTTKSLVAVPLVGRSGLVGVAEIMNPKNKDSFTGYDCEIFQTFCSQIAIAIENARLHKESIEKERIRQELEIASAVQKSFLPDLPTLQEGKLSVSAINMPAEKVGGDFYDFIQPEKEKVGILIGDVSGKGISAALYMAKVISDFRYIANRNDSTEAIFKHMNAMLSKTPRGMFLTATYLLIDILSGKLQISGAGHPPLLWLSGGEVKVLSIPSGPPLGILPADYPSAAISLKHGDRLILLTDGVFDAKNKKGKRIGFQKIVDFVKKQKKEEEIAQQIVDYVDNFSKGMERADDVTLVEVKWGDFRNNAETRTAGM